MMKKKLLLIGITILFIACGCVAVVLQARLFTNELKELSGVDQVVINIFKINDVAREKINTRTINDSEKINHIISKLRSYSNDWQYEGFSPPWSGITGRPAPVQIGFLKDGKLLTYVLIGYTEDKTYFIQQVPGPGRYLKSSEFEELMSFLEIDAKQGYYQWELSSQ